VLADLDGRIDIVLDAGPVDIGVESTVVDLTTVPPTVLRPGAIGIEQLRDILPDVQLRTKAVTTDDTPMPSPGLLSQHYAPRTPMTLYPRIPSAGPESFVAHVREVLATGKRVGVLATTEDASALRTLPVVIAELVAAHRCASKAGPSGPAGHAARPSLSDSAGRAALPCRVQKDPAG
jgi:L-threonylcarbamoyladenylate synthase